MSRKSAQKTARHKKNRSPGPARSTSTSGKYRMVLLFVALFAAQMILFYLLYSNTWLEGVFFAPLANLYARIAGYLLAVIGYTNTVIGDIITSPSSFLVSVKKGCDAAEPMAIFLAAIIAFPARIKSKFPAIAIGLAILFLLNIIRVAALYITGYHYPELFETMHLAVWQVVFLMVAIALWLVWLNRLPAKTGKT